MCNNNIDVFSNENEKKAVIIIIIIVGMWK
jgi:hypothetical protein